MEPGLSSAIETDDGDCLADSYLLGAGMIRESDQRALLRQSLA